jgi:outer membrane protein insertion porin family
MTRPTREAPHRTRSDARARLAVLALLACKPTAPPTTPPPTPPATTAPPATPAALAGPIVSIDLIGTTREHDAESALTATLGAAYDPAVIARDVRALWRLRGIADIHVDAKPVPGGVALRYRIDELPRIRKLELRGGPPLYTAAWRIRTADIKDVPQDPATIKQLVGELRGDLTDHAFLDATVTWRAAPADDGRVDIIVDVDAGPQVSLAALTLRGHKKLKTGELETIFRTHGIAVGQPFTRPAQDEALLAVTARYQDVGHVNAEILALSESRSPDHRTISTAYEIREGDAFRLGQLKVTGSLVAPVREYEKLLALRPGQPFNRSKIVAGIEKIRAMHRDRGAGEPDVTPLTELDRTTKKIDLTIEISTP